MQYSWQKLGLLCGLLIFLGSCGGSLENVFAPDPSLVEQQEQSDSGDGATTALPTDFPEEIPRYPEAQLLQVEGNRTTWAIADNVQSLEAFYRRAFATEPWEIITAPAPNPNGLLAITARTPDLEVTLSLSESASPATNDSEQAVTGTTFVLSYRRLGAETPTTPDPAPLDNADLSAQIQDLIALDIFTASEFQANEIITRRQFARWLLKAHNALYGDRPNQQIRLANTTSTPLFTDVSANNPDFPYIQGLAEAGIIPSNLTNETVTTFRPDAPLTRETLITWKVPLDRRQALPQTSLENIAETWGFQDATQIDTRALQALYVDFQNGDQANVRRVFGYTTLFQPQKNVTQQEAAIALWYFGYQSDGLSAATVRQNNQTENQTETTPSETPPP
ncbi:S-layer homology domain-containing protein [Picosynechococcus sp. NKBG15041c]|uniref:S-layer homology domain-containing protein n=1 Tax=Picosynechococcus sp. NKBG15041c TaxID=1407650 RepID=UPI00041E71A1|nr:S-layer homology domain-containing protein [Picosynechococcus sp. NKBG15041c]